MDRHAHGYWSYGKQRAHPGGSRHGACQRRGVGASRSSVQRNPRYFSEAAGYAGNDTVAGSFKQRLDLLTGEFPEWFPEFPTTPTDHGFVLFQCYRAGFD
jgi:hypothetical protein